MAESKVLKNWSSRVEDLLDDGDQEGAIQLLEEVIASLEKSGSAATDLSLAPALHDLAMLLDRQGLSLKADNLRSWELVIKQRAQDADESGPWEEKSDLLFSNCNSEASDISRCKLGSCENKRDGQHVEIPAAEEDWEAVLHNLPSRASSLSITRNVAQQQSVSKKNTVKRGRGAFTFGASGLYSDRISDLAVAEAELLGLEQKNADVGNSNLGASHVLLVDGFPSTTTTKELEDLFKPFSTAGFAIRWLNDTSALAVFVNPATACQALAAAHSSQFKVQNFDDAVLMHDLVSKKDLEPHVRRPATSTQVAQRMIAGALSKQETGRRLHAKVKGSTKESQEREEQRRQRLISRQKLREEAWGLD
ncbi:hypothetical protein O6H91_14G023800 [Diphasiastrum complanatum]|uniref:Uncharacterized protein n=1 Tax=Diphasiastrum complanatum TaxID=34168 RepID=A0ACC2BMA4_DIPCM|nr:hypothetical protein O6H91_14G023800 [Diphasiastrum complanatum]